ncbi:MAG: metallophosphoesterase [Anaerolineae bacterium]|nr:metallophosphoesterase [Anaerolineae bacterium]
MSYLAGGKQPDQQADPAPAPIPDSLTPTVWAISDTHLSFARPRDQTRFGAKWHDHARRLAAAWCARIQPEDVVLLPGDLSWAHSPTGVQPDIDWLAALPGHKVLARGNHDYWWKQLAQVERDVLADRQQLYAVQGTCLNVRGALICGTMGHIAPNDPYYRPKKRRSYERERGWLEQALKQAQGCRTDGEPVLLMLHYPPFTSDGQPSGFTEIIRRYRPDVCVYGHLHFEQEWAVAADERRDGTRYHLVACDYLDMLPRRVWPPCESPG